MRSLYPSHTRSAYLHVCDIFAQTWLNLCRYIHASPSNLVARLTSRNLHLIALRISTYLSLKPDVVLKHWASVKIIRSKSSATDADFGGDDEVCKMIVNKFEQLGGEGVSYADIAKRAWEVGRAGLATKVSFLCVWITKSCSTKFFA